MKVLTAVRGKKRGYTNSTMMCDVISIPLQWLSLILEFGCNMAVMRIKVKVCG